MLTIITTIFLILMLLLALVGVITIAVIYCTIRDEAEREKDGKDNQISE